MQRRHPDDRAILAFALPALGALAADPLVSVVDTAFVGRLGTEALGALGVNAGIFSLAFLVFNFLAYGTTPLVATALGDGRRAEAGRLVSAALGIAVVLGMVAALLLWGLAETLVAWMGAEGSLVDATLVYLRVRLFAAPAVLLVTVGHGAFRGYGDTRTPLWITLALNAVNLVLDPLLIFGLGWGLAGAAWSTVVAQWCGALVFVWALRRGPVALLRPGLGDVGRLLGVGSILSVRTFALVFALTAATSLATRLGEVSIAAHQVASQLWLMFALFVDAFAMAGQSLVADHLGAGRPGAARRVARRLLQWGVGTGLLLALLVAGLGPMWPWMFGLESRVETALLAVLPIVAIMQPLNAAVFVGDGIFMGARAFGTLAWQMVVAVVMTLAALGLNLRLGGGIVGIWACIALLIALRGTGQALWFWGPRGILPEEQNI